MAKYRKKPVVVEADGPWMVAGDLATIVGPPHEMDAPRKHCGNLWQQHGWIETLEGGHIVCPGDWIITGVKGEKYPCKPDIFSATYEQVVDDSHGMTADQVREIWGEQQFTPRGMGALPPQSGGGQ